MAVYASPRQTVIAGPPERVDAVIAAVAAQDRLARRVEVDVASHHPIIDPILPELRAALADLAPQRPDHPDHQHRRRGRWRHRYSMPSTGWPTCATRCGSPRRSPPPAPPRHVRRNQPAPAAHPRHHRHRGHRTRHLGNAAGPGPRPSSSTPSSPPSGPPIGRHRRSPRRAPAHAPGTTPTTGSPPPAATPLGNASPAGRGCHGSDERHAGMGKHTRPGSCSGSATIASTTRACCPGRPTPNWRWPPRPTPSEPMVTSPGRSVSFAWIR